MAELPLLPDQTHLCLDRRCALRQAISRFGEGPVGAFQLQKAAAFQVVVGPDRPSRCPRQGDGVGLPCHSSARRSCWCSGQTPSRPGVNPDLGQGHNFRRDLRVRVDGCQSHLAISTGPATSPRSALGGDAVFDFRKSLFGTKHHLRIREDRSVHGVQPNEPGDSVSTKREEVVTAAVAVKQDAPAITASTSGMSKMESTSAVNGLSRPAG